MKYVRFTLYVAFWLLVSVPVGLLILLAQGLLGVIAIVCFTVFLDFESANNMRINLYEEASAAVLAEWRTFVRTARGFLR